MVEIILGITLILLAIGILLISAGIKVIKILSVKLINTLISNAPSIIAGIIGFLFGKVIK